MRRGTPWAFGGALIGLILAVALITIVRVLGASRAGFSAPVLTVIPLPTPTTPVISSPTPAPLPTPTLSPVPNAPKQFVAGELVEVAGTGGDGLRVRESPGLEAKVLIIGLESEVFEVTEGPIETDGYSWWHLVNPFDPSKQGWAVDLFLSPIESAP